MSTSEVNRLKADVEANADLADELSNLALATPERVVTWAGSRGYTLTADDVPSLFDDELSDGDLEQVAGGWDQGGG